MEDIEKLQFALKSFAGLTDEDFLLSKDLWLPRDYRKNDYYNEHRNVCKHLGFILDGVFRTYYLDETTGEEKNVFFFSENQVIVSYKSFITQTPCNYHTQAMTDARILYIHIDQLNKLYTQSHRWEKLGRLIAETAFMISMDRTESFLFQTPEQRYLELMRQHPTIFNSIPLYHISSYLGIQGPSLSRIRKRISL